jgi:Cu/Ag efflux protein CusF
VRRGRARGLAVAFLLLVAPAGCERPPETPPESYRVRAQVRQLPAPNAARGEIYVRHEAVPGFKDADGEAVGMGSMSMSFPLADVGLAAGLAVGDRIEMTFEVSWHGGHPLAVTAIEKLPADTRLAFEAPEPGAAGPPGGVPR